MKNIIKISLVLLISFLLTNIFIKSIFFAEIPRLRPNIGKNLIANMSYFLNTNIFKNKNISPSNNTAVVNNFPTTAPNNLLKSLSKGVYAEEDSSGNIKNIQYRLDEINWIDNNIIVNGKECHMKIPEGVVIPDKILKDICK